MLNLLVLLIILQLVPAKPILEGLLGRNEPSYAPSYVECPSNPIFRQANNQLSPMETDWLKRRASNTAPALRYFLKYTAKLSDEEIKSVLPGNNKSLVIALAPSGGSFRALLTGAGELSALDNRTKGAFEYGLGGLLQASTYLAGLSGSSWLVGSLAANDFPGIDEILKERSIWDLEHLYLTNNGVRPFGALTEWQQIIHDVHTKKYIGFDTTATDYYARALATQLFSKESRYGLNLSFLSLRERGPILSGDMPLPIIEAVGKPTDKDVIILNLTVFEMNPFEFGTWDMYGNGFIDMKYLGSNITAGKASQCATNFDNIGFLVGASLTMFDAVLQELSSSLSGLKGKLMSLVQRFLKPYIEKRDLVAVIDRNPFFKADSGSLDHLRESRLLYLVDGGEDFQKIPLPPLIQKQRKVDIIFAYDLGSETKDNWPGGYSLINSYERQFLPVGNNTAVPYVPDPYSMWALNFTHRPVFFGCDARNLTHLNHIPPVIAYFANTPYSYNSNASTLQFKFTEEEYRGHIGNGFEIATRGNRSEDPDFATCVGCAIIKREQDRQGIEPSKKCLSCFLRYCWNGELVKPGQTYTHGGLGYNGVLADEAVRVYGSTKGEKEASQNNTKGVSRLYKLPGALEKAPLNYSLDAAILKGNLTGKLDLDNVDT